VTVVDSIELPDLDSFAMLSGAERDRVTMDVERAFRKISAFRSQIIHTVDASQSYRDDFHHSAANWFCGVTNTSKSSALREVRVSRLLSEMPLLEAAAAAGNIGAEQMRLLRDLHANPRCRAKLPESDALLVAEARSMVFEDFVQVCRRWELGADPDGAHRDHEASRTNRHVSTTRLGHGHRLIAEGDALTGEEMTKILDAHAQAEYETDVAERFAQYGENADRFELRRTARQRRYDALVKICTKAAGTTGDTDREPLVVIISTAAEVQAAVNAYFGTYVAPFDGGVVACDDVDDIGPSARMRLCETVGGAPVDPHDLAVAAIFGRIRQIVIDPDGVVINLGRTSRIFTGSARKAILLSGDRCIGPGCHVRHRQMQIDHLDPWPKGGATDQDNGAPMCGRTNRDKHAGGFTVMRDNTGWHWFRPDGSELCPRPPPNTS
jgi:hypothetical protein